MNAFASSRDVAGWRGSRAGAILGLLVMLGALGAVRVVNALRADNIARDGCIYLRMAKDFGERPPIEVLRAYDYHPGYSAVVGWVARSLGATWPEGWITVGRGVSIFFSLAGLAGVFIMALRTYGRQVAWLTVLLMGLASAYVELSSDVLSDPQAAALGILADLRMPEPEELGPS
ncbi:MAG: hypothetical protein ACLFV7_02015, partial [Phycisphaerae bacterium]